MPLSRRLVIALYWIISFLVVIGFFWQKPVSFTDELLFEEAAYHMYLHGDWLTPHLNNQVWIEKPPLYFWLTAPLYYLSEPTVIIRRLWNLVFALGTLLITYKLARKHTTQTTSMVTVFLVATNILFFNMTKTASLDMAATFFITASIWVYQKSGYQSALLAGLLAGLALLSRSFLALTPLAVLGWNCLLQPRTMIHWKRWLLLIVTALGVALPWNVYAYWQHPTEYLEKHWFFNFHQHVFEITPGQTTLTPLDFVWGTLTFYNYFGVLAMLFLVRYHKKINKEGLFLVWWIVIVLLPLTLSQTRQIWYTLQLVPALSLLTARWMVVGFSHIYSSLNKKGREFTHFMVYAFPVTVFIVLLNHLPSEVPRLQILESFINITPDHTPIYTLNLKTIHDTNLFNPRQVYVTDLETLNSIPKPIYLHTIDTVQYRQVLDQVTCCSVVTIDQKKEDRLLMIGEK